MGSKEYMFSRIKNYKRDGEWAGAAGVRCGCVETGEMRGKAQL